MVAILKSYEEGDDGGGVELPPMSDERVSDGRVSDGKFSDGFDDALAFQAT
jgi:hypothetical protein